MPAPANRRGYADIRRSVGPNERKSGFRARRRAAIRPLSRQEENECDQGFSGPAVDVAGRHTNIEHTVRYLGVDIDDALTLSERTEL